MTHNPAVKNLLWLDPFQSLPASTSAQLGALGLVIRPVRTLEDFTLSLPWANGLVVRLQDNDQLLVELQTLMAQQQKQLPVVARIDRRQFELAIAAMHKGVVHVMPMDEWTLPAWQVAKQSMTDAWHTALDLASSNPATSVPSAPSAPFAPLSGAARSVVYVDPASLHLLALAQRVAQTQVTVLIQGPTGAGKEVLARVVHESSPRARGPFVALNCAALPEHLIEDMLFGHEKGSFTGAAKEHRGAFEQAHGGTLFLDELAEMPVHLQAKLLRVLQERQVMRLGSERALAVDVRVVTATNKDLRQAIVDKEFREDLYFRISTFKLTVPPLSQRRGDILPLVAQLLVRHAHSGRVLHISQEAQWALHQYAWPGNVRELENVVMRAVVLCTGDTITPAHLMFDDAATLPVMAMPEAPAFAPMPVMNMPLDSSVESGMDTDMDTEMDDDLEASTLQKEIKNSELQIIMTAIKTTCSRMEAAKKLGISPRTLRYKLAKLKENGHELAWLN